MKSTFKTYLSEMWLPSYDRERWVSRNEVEMEALSALADKVAWRTYVGMFVYFACIAALLAWTIHQRPITDHATLVWLVFVLGSGWMFNVIATTHASHHPFSLLSASNDGCRHVLNLCDASPEANAYRNIIVAKRPMYVVDLQTMEHHWGHAWRTKKASASQDLCKRVHNVEVA